MLSKTEDGVWKTTSKLNLTISQENLNKRPLSGDIRNLDDVITMHIPEEIVQKQKDELDNIALPTVKYNVKHKYHNLFKDGNNSGPVPLQNKYFPGEIFEGAITTSNAFTKRVHDNLIAHSELDQLLTNNEATVRLKQKEVISLTEFVKIKKLDLQGQDYSRQFFNKIILKVSGPLDMI